MKEIRLGHEERYRDGAWVQGGLEGMEKYIGLGGRKVRGKVGPGHE